MTEDETIELGWLTVEAERLGLHLRNHQNADPPGAVLIYIQEARQFPGRAFQNKPPSLAKYISIEQAQEFLATYKAAFPKGRTDEQAT